MVTYEKQNINKDSNMNMKGLPNNFYSNVERNSINYWLMNSHAFYRDSLYEMLYNLRPEIENINEDKDLIILNKDYLLEDMKKNKIYYEEFISEETKFNYNNEIEKQERLFGKEILDLKKPLTFKSFLLESSSFLFFIFFTILIIVDQKYFNFFSNSFHMCFMLVLTFLFLVKVNSLSKEF